MSRYFDLSRKHSYSLLFALPLLVVYEAGAALIATSTQGLRNGADVLLRTLLAAGGVHGTLAFTAILVLGAAVLIARERRREKVPLNGAVFAGMAAESAVYALMFGFVVGGITNFALHGWQLSAGTGVLDRLPVGDAIVLSLGAGVYEELLFRVLLVGGLLAVFASAGLGKKPSKVYAVILGALIFSAFHYVGPYADKLEVYSFAYRFVSGLAFSMLFVTRGFGIAAWTHALYDVFVTFAHR